MMNLSQNSLSSEGCVTRETLNSRHVTANQQRPPHLTPKTLPLENIAEG